MSVSVNIVRRFATVKPHVPLIKFRKGGPDHVAAAATQSSPAAAAPVAAPG